MQIMRNHYINYIPHEDHIVKKDGYLTLNYSCYASKLIRTPEEKTNLITSMFHINHIVWMLYNILHVHT